MKHKQIFALMIGILTLFSGCDQDQVEDVTASESGNSAFVKADLLGKWSLSHFEGKTHPFTAYEVGDRAVIRSSEELIFNSDGSYTDTEVEYVEGYEGNPIVIKSKGIYSVGSSSILYLQMKEITVSIPDEIKAFLESEGVSGEPEYPAEAYEEVGLPFKLAGDTLTISTPIQDIQGIQSLYGKTYVRNSN